MSEGILGQGISTTNKCWLSLQLSWCESSNCIWVVKDRKPPQPKAKVLIRMQWSGTLYGTAGFADLPWWDIPSRGRASHCLLCEKVEWLSLPRVTPEKPGQWQHCSCIGMLCATTTTWMPLSAKGQEIQDSELNLHIKTCALQSHLGKYPLQDGEPPCVSKYILPRGRNLLFPF